MSAMFSLASGASVMTYSEVPHPASHDDRDACSQWPHEPHEVWHTGRIGLVQDIEGREVANERHGDDKRRNSPNPGSKYVQWILREFVAAVGEGVRYLTRVDYPERDRVRD